LERALAAHRAGRLEEAAGLYRNWLTLRPNDPTVLHLAGVLAFQRGDAARALQLLGRAVRLRPNQAEFQLHYGNVLRAQGRWEEALAAWQAALVQRPDQAEPHYNRGNLLKQLGRGEEALAAYEKALCLDPGLTAARINRGNLLRSQGQLEAALAAYEAALEREPLLVEGHFNRALVLEQLGRWPAAADSWERVLAQQPGQVTAALALSVLRRRQGRIAEALAVLEAACAALSEETSVPVELWNNQALCLKDLGKVSAARAVFDQALAFDPQAQEVRFNRGKLRLGQGETIEGWRDYEARLKMPEFVSLAGLKISCPLWQGEVLAGHRLLVWREQGLGDELLFASLYSSLVRTGGTCVVLCDPRLHGLFSRNFPEIQFVAFEAACETGCKIEGVFDYICPAGELARFLVPRLGNWPGKRAFLEPEPLLRSEWQERLAELGPGLRVGLCWRSQDLSGTRQESYLPLAKWSPLFQIPGIHWINLQYDLNDNNKYPDEEWITGRGENLVSWPGLDQKNDLENTAALIAGLDLVISAPTAVGELAAALGVPVWRFDRLGTWTSLGTGCRPWFPAQHLFIAPRISSLEGIPARMAHFLKLQKEIFNHRSLMDS
jgi:tetratricopeptide (TPR) repeat protein